MLDPPAFLRGMMTTNRAIGQTPPDKANELFSQLLDTPNRAIEIREQLLRDLRQELELLGNLQEQHLFPVLEQHPETADLVRMLAMTIGRPRRFWTNSRRRRRTPTPSRHWWQS
jgi:hypothetical protein